MAISLYDRPAEQQLVDTYVPIPFGELAAAGQARQQAFSQGLAMEEAVSTQLGDVDALERIQLLGTDTRVDLPDADLVREAASKYEGRIDDISKSYRDKSSPEYSTEMRQLVRDLRRDFGPKGVFGRAAASKAEYQRLQALAAKHPDVLRHRYAAINRELLAGVSPDRVSQLQVMSGVGKGTDIGKRLQDFLKDKKARHMAAFNITDPNDPRLINTYEQEGISSEEIAADVMRLLDRDPALAEELSMMEEFARQQGQDVNMEAYKKGLADTMGNLFMQDKVDFSSDWDPYQLHAFKKQLDEPAFTDVGIDTFVNNVLYSIDNPRALRNKINTQNSRLEEADLAIQALEKELTVTEDGSKKLLRYNPNTKQLEDRTFEYTQALQRRDQENIKLQQLNDYDYRLRREAGIDEETIQENIRKGVVTESDVAKAKKKAYKVGLETARVRIKQARVFDSMTPIDELERRVLEGKTREQFAEEYSESNYVEKLDYFNEGYKKYEDKLKNSKEYSVDIVTTVPFTGNVKNLKSTFEETIRSSDPQSLNFRWFEGGQEGKYGELTADEKAKIDPSKTTVTGYALDNRVGQGGQAGIVQTVYDKKGDRIGTVILSDGVKGLREALLSTNRLDATVLDLTAQLQRQLGPKFSEVGEGPITIGFGKNAFNVSVQSPESPDNKTGKWLLKMPSSKKNPNVVGVRDFNSEDELVAAMALLGKNFIETLKNTK